MVIPTKSSNKAARNAILTHTGRYLDTLGSWSTYRDLSSLEDVPARLAQVTYTFTGLAGLAEGRPHLSGLLGVVIAVHALEQVTGGLATAGICLAVRSQPLARYRGVLIRRSPFSRWVHLLDRLPGLRVLESTGYYFVESGRTWHCQSVTLELAESLRTLTRIRSLSLPHREYLFDRVVIVPGEREPAEGEKTIAIQRIIDVVKGDEEPEAVPGFIGRINELENLISPLTCAKQFLFMVNWLLIDSDERDDGSGHVDYDSLIKGKPSGGLGGTSVWPRPPSPGNGPSTGWPSTSRAAGGSDTTSGPVSGQSREPGPRPVPIRPLNPVTPKPAMQQIPLNSMQLASPPANSRRPPPPPSPPPNFPDDDVPPT
jgi:hypothetical protein